jgi:hypothetical protein
VTPSFGVTSSGFAGGGAVGFRLPINASSDSLIYPVGARIGALGTTFNGSNNYGTPVFNYGVKIPAIVYAEGEFANPMISSAVAAILPRTQIKFFSTVGIAGQFETFNTLEQIRELSPVPRRLTAPPMWGNSGSLRPSRLSGR